MLHILHALGGRFGNVHRTAAKNRTTGGKYREFRNGHPNRHKLCSLCPQAPESTATPAADTPLWLQMGRLTGKVQSC